MSSANQVINARLADNLETWLITGVAGFIGSHLLEALLAKGQSVIGLDNFSTGTQVNLDAVKNIVTPDQWKQFRFIQGDLRDLKACQQSCSGATIVLHQAALGSVPRSVKDPISTHQSNVDGFLNILVAARDAGVRSFIYASSSAVYGDHHAIPRKEENIGRPLSPYALSKAINEYYAEVFLKSYGFAAIGLRYFNVFGNRQLTTGAYAAVIPRWKSEMMAGAPVTIFGDGTTSRDFCFIDNVVQANLLAATSSDSQLSGQIFNIAYGEQTSLNQLFQIMRELLTGRENAVADMTPIYREFRVGDVAHSLADISKAKELLGYSPSVSVNVGLKKYCHTVPESQNSTRARKSITL